MKGNYKGFFIKYISPFLIGVILIIVYSKIIEHYDLNKGDLLAAILVLLPVATMISSNIKGPKIPHETLDRLYNYYIVRKTESQKLENFHINEHINSETFVVKNSKSKMFLGFIGASVFLAFGFYLVKEGLYVFSAAAAYIYSQSLLNHWRAMDDNEPKIIMDTKGIATPEIGFVKWTEVKLVQLRDTSSNETDYTNLDIFLTEKEKWKHPEFTICINGLNRSYKELKNKIKELSGTAPNIV